MRTLQCIGAAALLLLSVFAMPARADSVGTPAGAADSAGTPVGTKISFSSLDASHPRQVYGTLYLPGGASGPCPAVVIVHGTAGIDARGALYRQPLLNAGIAVFEVNFKTGIYTSPMDRPPLDTFLPLAFAALKQLRSLPSIAPNRIGIMGFSLGGAITLRTALESSRKMWMGDEKGFAVHAGFYPVARAFIPKIKSGDELTGAPIIVFYGTEDVYGDGSAIPELKRLLADKFKFNLITYEYPGAAHGFNLNAPPLTYSDPAAKNGRGYMAYDAAATSDSLPKLIDFLRANLAAK